MNIKRGERRSSFSHRDSPLHLQREDRDGDGFGAHDSHLRSLGFCHRDRLQKKGARASVLNLQRISHIIFAALALTPSVDDDGRASTQIATDDGRASIQIATGNGRASIPTAISPLRSVDGDGRASIQSGNGDGRASIQIATGYGRASIPIANLPLRQL